MRADKNAGGDAGSRISNAFFVQIELGSSFRERQIRDFARDDIKKEYQSLMPSNGATPTSKRLAKLLFIGEWYVWSNAVFSVDIVFPPHVEQQLAHDCGLLTTMPL